MIAALPGPPAAKVAPMNLDALIQTKDPARCDFGAEFNAVGERLFVIDPVTKKIIPGMLAFPEKYAGAFGKPEYQAQADGTLVLTMPMVGIWKGFPLVAIVTSANALGKPAKTMFVLKTDYATAEKRFAGDFGTNRKSAYSVSRIPDVTGHALLNCEQK